MEIEPWVSWRPPDHTQVIGSTHLKGGGTTKTTAAIMLGHALARLGFSVRVVSYDRVHSAVSWAEKAHAGVGMGGSAARPWPENYEVEAANSLEELYGLVHGSQADFTIIDGGPADPDGLKALAALCHKIIIPTEPGYLTAEQVSPTFELVYQVEADQGREIDIRVLMVRVKAATAIAKQVEDALHELNLPTMTTRIADNALVTRAAHSVPTRLFGYDLVARELVPSINGERKELAAP